MAGEQHLISRAPGLPGQRQDADPGTTGGLAISQAQETLLDADDDSNEGTGLTDSTTIRREQTPQRSDGTEHWNIFHPATAQREDGQRQRGQQPWRSRRR